MVIQPRRKMLTSHRRAARAGWVIRLRCHRWMLQQEMRRGYRLAHIGQRAPRTPGAATGTGALGLIEPSGVFPQDR
jgi:hypothetical protein